MAGLNLLERFSKLSRPWWLLLPAATQSKILEEREISLMVMNSFGRNSRKHLATVDGRGQQISHSVLRIKDHSVIQGHRPEKEQNDAFDSGFSKVRWPDGKHNELPSRAADVQTYPLPAESKLAADFRMEIAGLDLPVFNKVLRALEDQPLREEQIYLLGMYKGVAHEQGTPIRTGADWDRDGELADNSFDDLFHWEIDE